MIQYLKFSLFLFGIISVNSSLHLHGIAPLPVQDEKQTEQAGQPRIYRLTDNIQPLSYELRMLPDLTKFTFSGTVRINVLVTFSTDTICLHSKDLTINSCQLKKAESPIESKHKFDEIDDLLIIETTQQLTYDTKYTIIIEFKGTLCDNMLGFYKSSYTINNEERWLAATQFEPVHAREAFPCFDEPRFKAPFTIFVAHFPNQVATSNMPTDYVLPVDSTIGDRQLTKFKETPPMATYLVSFMISDFTYVTDETRKIHVWTRKNAIQHTSYALKQSAKLLKHLEAYTGISYQLPKLDVVALPDFNGLGMENWGMTTYKEKYVILDEQASSTMQKALVTQLICHEFSHMWFGDLTTPAWWDFLWLKEGFAKYFEYFATAAVEPTWSLDQLFVVEVMHYSLWNEAGMHIAMTTSVKTKSQIYGRFNVISYQKTASIIRMMEHVLSPITFQSALHNYLKAGYKKHGGTVVPAHLFKALDQQAYRDSPPLPPGFTVSQIMKTWTENQGYPIIFVTRDYITLKTKIEQLPNSQNGPSLGVPKWIIPLTYTTKSEQKFSNTQPSLWLFDNQVLTLPHQVPATDRVLFNVQHAGYYRVQYDYYNWRRLIAQLHEDPSKIHVLNRAQLLDDALALANDGKLNYSIALRLTEYLAKEYNLIPWISALGYLDSLYSRFEGTVIYHVIEEFLRNILEAVFEKLGFDIKSTDDHVTKTGKPLFLYLACKLKIVGCVERALEEYKKNKNDISKINSDVKREVLCVALTYSESLETDFKYIWGGYLKSDIAYDKEIILRSLPCANGEELHEKITDKLVDSKNKEFRRQDRYLIFGIYASATPATNAGLSYIYKLISKETALSQLDIFGMETIVTIVYNIAKNIKFSSQTEKLEKMKKILSEMNQKKYENLLEAIHHAFTEGISRITKSKLKAELLMEEMKVLSQETTSTPSTATSVMISFLCLCLTMVIIFVT